MQNRFKQADGWGRDEVTLEAGNAKNVNVRDPSWQNGSTRILSCCRWRRCYSARMQVLGGAQCCKQRGKEEVWTSKARAGVADAHKHCGSTARGLQRRQWRQVAYNAQACAAQPHAPAHGSLVALGARAHPQRLAPLPSS